MKKIDPFYRYLQIILYPFTHADLKQQEKFFVQSNINKHRLVQRINLICCIFVFIGFQSIPLSQVGDVTTALLAPVMVMGAAWFGVSFGAVPSKLITVSMQVTFAMYTAFKLSFSVMLLAIGFLTTWHFYPLLVILYLTVDFSCIQYDTADGLKAGLDETLLHHSRAAILYYENEGIEVKEQEDKK